MSHLKHGIEKEKHLESESKKQIIAKKMGGAKLSKGDWKRAEVPSYLRIPKGKGEKSSWPHGHKLPGKNFEI